MNMQTELAMKTDEVLRVELEVFKREHRDLDQAIDALQAVARCPWRDRPGRAQSSVMAVETARRSDEHLAISDLIGWRLTS